MINVLADISELLTYQPIIVSNHSNVIGLQKCGPFPVIGGILFVVMLFPIQFYDKPDRGAVKITDIIADNLLTIKLEWIGPQNRNQIPVSIISFYTFIIRL